MVTINIKGQIPTDKLNISNKDSSIYNEEINCELIINKAKLLTISSYGVIKIDSVIESLLNQKVSYYYKSFFTNNYLVIKIDDEQEFKVEYRNGVSNKFYGASDCFFIIVFSFNTERFYLLDGFRYSDYDELSAELSSYPSSGDMYELLNQHYSFSERKNLNNKKKFLSKKCICDSNKYNVVKFYKKSK